MNTPALCDLARRQVLLLVVNCCVCSALAGFRVIVESVVLSGIQSSLTMLIAVIVSFVDQQRQ